MLFHLQRKEFQIFNRICSKDSNNGAMWTATTFAAIAANDNKNRNYIILVQTPLIVRLNYLNDLYNKDEVSKNEYENYIVYFVLFFTVNSFYLVFLSHLLSLYACFISFFSRHRLGETNFFFASTMKWQINKRVRFFSYSFMTLFITCVRNLKVLFRMKTFEIVSNNNMI